MPNVKEVIRNSRIREVDTLLNEKIENVKKEGYRVEFGTIGKKTTYALLTNTSDGTEFVGYTYIRDMKYYQENVGKLKALQQAIAHKEVLGQRYSS